jgi:hypothetical protein
MLEFCLLLGQLLYYFFDCPLERALWYIRMKVGLTLPLENHKIDELHLFGEYSEVRTILMSSHSTSEISSSVAPAFMVEKDKADGWQDIFSLAFF